jgi:hypothetical protein
MYEYNRNLSDAGLTVTKAMPAAAANHNTPTLDLGQVTGGDVEAAVIEIAVPALPSLVDAKTVTITIQDSANDSSYAAIDPLISTVITGAGGVGAAAKTIRFRLPPVCRRYVQANIAVLTGGGDNTAVSLAMRVLV